MKSRTLISLVHSPVTKGSRWSAFASAGSSSTVDMLKLLGGSGLQLGLGFAGAARGRACLAQQQREHDRQQHAPDQRLEADLVMLERALAAAAGAREHAGKHRAEQRREREVDEVDHS